MGGQGLGGHRVSEFSLQRKQKQKISKKKKKKKIVLGGWGWGGAKENYFSMNPNLK